MRRFLLTLLLALVGVGFGAAPAAFGSTASTLGDFNGDGYADLAVGVPREDVGTVTNAGVVNVIHGTAEGLSGTGGQLWHQDSPGIRDAVEAEGFGAALASGDFNGDGRADLAVAVPGERIGGMRGTGAVAVLYGAVGGLAAAGNQLWHQDSAGIRDAAELDDHFGSALTAGDFNGDRVADLAVGVPGEEIPGATEFGLDHGAVNVLYGSASGLVASGNQLWHQGRPGVQDDAEEHEAFGSVLSSGDFNGDTRADLVVGVKNERVGNIAHAGAVNVLYGSAIGLVASGSQFWHQDRAGIPDDPEEQEFYGRALAPGDFNGDHRDDLAVGVGEGVGGFIPGASNVLYGSDAGLLASGNQLWDQDRAGVFDAAEDGDQFGFALGAGDLDGDGRADLAVGAPSEALGAASTAGAVNVFYGSAAGLSAYGNQLWHQDRPGIADAVEQHDGFGSALAAGDLNGDTRYDLAVGAPLEDVGTVSDAGAINVLYGTPQRLSATGNQLFHQDSPGVPETLERSDAFGSVLVSGAPAAP